MFAISQKALTIVRNFSTSMIRQFYLVIALTFFLSCNSMNDQERTSLTDTTSPKHITRPKFELQYPSAWHIDTADKSYDPGSYLSIQAPFENSQSLFFIFNTSINEEEFIQGQVKAQLDKTIKNGHVTLFDHWGSFSGHGATITGKFLGAMNGEMEFFCYSSDSISFLTAIQYFDHNKESVLPGFRLIKSSFKLKK